MITRAVLVSFTVVHCKVFENNSSAMLSIIPQLVFEGEVGDSPRSDIAIDDFSMSQSYVIDDVICPLRPACARPPVTPPTPSPPTGEYNGK